MITGLSFEQILVWSQFSKTSNAELISILLERGTKQINRGLLSGVPTEFLKATTSQLLLTRI